MTQVSNALLQDLATMVEQLVRFLGVSYDKAQLESMVEHCHQLIDQCCNAEALPVGRGMFKTHSKTLPGEVASNFQGVLDVKILLLCKGWEGADGWCSLRAGLFCSQVR